MKRLWSVVISLVASWVAACVPALVFALRGETSVSDLPLWERGVVNWSVLALTALIFAIKIICVLGILLTIVTTLVFIAHLFLRIGRNRNVRGSDHDEVRATSARQAQRVEGR